jgi:hypothetical protein
LVFFPRAFFIKTHNTYALTKYKEKHY